MAKGRRTHENERPRTVDFIGVAAPRSGTTWLTRCLSEHPDICFSAEKETHFFDRDRVFERGIGYYQSLFDHCHQTTVRGEFSPSYYLHEGAAERITRVAPHAKLIVCLRNPVDRAFSNYRFTKARKGKYRSFDKLLENPEQNPIERGLYYKYLSQFLPYFSREQVFVLIYEEACKQPELTVQQLYRFLGVDDSYVPEAMSKATNTAGGTAYHVPHLNALLEKRKHLHKTKWGRQCILLMRKIGIRALVWRLQKLNKTTAQRQNKERMTKEQRQRLLNYYKDDIDRLEQYLSRDLSIWRS